jgi:LacI family transcriptional regulator/LacI family purine nucleotide synthesis repressor
MVKHGVTMQDIADKLGISKNAVSLALNGKAGVGEELRKTVVQTAQLLNYARMGEDRSSTHNILILIPEYIRNDEYFYSKIYWSIERESRARGFNVVTCTVTEVNEKNLSLPDLSTVLEFRGMILVGVVSREYLRFIQGLGLGLVLVDHYYDDIPVDSVVTDNIAGTCNITKYLLDLGHTELGFIAPVNMTSSFNERWTGFRKALKDAGVPLREEFCALASSPLASLLSSEAELHAIIERLGGSPTAWVCGNDRIAVALLNVLHGQGKRIPEDVSVVGFDDIDLAACVIPNLTTVHVDRESMGKLAIEKLLTSGEAGHVVSRSSLFTSIVIRKSAARPLSGQ